MFKVLVMPSARRWIHNHLNCESRQPHGQTLSTPLRFICAALANLMSYVLMHAGPLGLLCTCRLMPPSDSHESRSKDRVFVLCLGVCSPPRGLAALCSSQHGSPLFPQQLVPLPVCFLALRHNLRGTAPFCPDPAIQNYMPASILIYH